MEHVIIPVVKYALVSQMFLRPLADSCTTLDVSSPNKAQSSITREQPKQKFIKINK